ncbi:hypothetical protein BKA67DRAFT_359903 [Truncatella angustata]|uniref:Uncharacterized protein n=1 Tax=Truncatella angustata TaxID=152316 RepID=A0A9P8UE77_9PEZI|nr:uncharacterized protein BKA67DRAFT_359903 [Truncatella angustata]KAH6648301.1 hypothetical protein BKA67DRAFT_359903 [Truncatella angustata]
MAVYTKFLSNALLPQPDAKAMRDAFIRLNVKCPEGTYDINIEPLKDDVLFESEQAILSGFAALCEDAYGPLRPNSKQAAPESRASMKPLPALHETGHTTHNNIHNETLIASESDQATIERQIDIDMDSNSCKRHDIVREDQGQQDLLDEVRPAQSSSLHGRASTPFPSAWTAINTPVLAKKQSNPPGLQREDHNLEKEQSLVVPAFISDRSADLTEQAFDPEWRQKRDTKNQCKAQAVWSTPEHESSPGQSTNLRSTVNPRLQDTAVNNRAGTHHLQLTSQRELRTISMTPEPEILRHRGAPPRDLDVPPSMRYSYHQGSERHMPNTVPGGVYQMTPPSSIQKDREPWHNRNTSRSQPSATGLKQTTISFGGPWQRPKHQIDHKQADTTEGQDSLVDAANLQIPCDRGSENTAIEKSLAPEGSSIQMNSNAESKIIQSEARYQQISRDGKAFSKLRSTDSRSTEIFLMDKTPIMTALPTGDPRAYLLRRQKSMAADERMGRPKKFRRVKSVLLPFENVINDNQTREITLPIQIDLQGLPDTLVSFKKYDKYILEGDVEEALDMNLCESCRIEERLNALLSNWSERLGERIVVESNLTSVIKGKGVDV